LTRFVVTSIHVAVVLHIEVVNAFEPAVGGDDRNAE
jgi:hypothetical protein